MSDKYHYDNMTDSQIEERNEKFRTYHNTKDAKMNHSIAAKS